MGSVVAVHRLIVACGIYLTQGSNPCLLRWPVDSFPLSHQGSPIILFFGSLKKIHFDCFLKKNLNISEIEVLVIPNQPFLPFPTRKVKTSVNSFAELLFFRKSSQIASGSGHEQSKRDLQKWLKWKSTGEPELTGNEGPPSAQIKAKNNNSKVFGSLYLHLGWN